MLNNPRSLRFISVLFVVGFFGGCGSDNGEDDLAAKAAFQASEVIIASGSIDELQYEVRESAIRIINPTKYPATLGQYNQNREIVEVGSIRTETTTEFLKDLLNLGDEGGVATHSFIHVDAIEGEIFFKGEFSIVAEVIEIIKDVLLGSLSQTQMAICFFADAIARETHLLEQLEENVSNCATASAESDAVKSSILDRLGTVVLSISTQSAQKTIPLQAEAE